MSETSNDLHPKRGATSLRDRLEREGELLFKWRSYTPLVPLALVVIWLLTGHTGTAVRSDTGVVLEFVCIAIGLLGVAIRVFTVGYAAKGTSGRTTESPRASLLSTAGPYSVVRHPLYVGNFLMWLAVGIYSQAWPVALLVIVFFWLQYERIAIAEEAYLRKQFGPLFENWAARTPAFLPRLRHWQPATTSFAWHTALRRERSGLLGLAAAFALLDAVRSFRVTGRVAVQATWLILLAVAVMFYLVLLPKARRRTPAASPLDAAPPA